MKLPRKLFISVVLLVLLLCDASDEMTKQTAEDEYEEAEETFSAECVAVMASGAVLGATATLVSLPTTACAVGFCSGGVASSSMASWFQSTVPNLVAKGGLFSMLQSMAATGNFGSSIPLAAVFFFFWRNDRTAYGKKRM